jgi:CRISPR-associated protein Csm1
VTLSAGIVLVHKKYPVVRFANLAENALKDAKSYRYRKEEQPTKNKISLLGEVLSWKDFEDAQKHAQMLRQAILNDQNGEKNLRAALQKIQSSKEQFDQQHQWAKEGNLKVTKVWRLFYTTRQYIKKPRRRQENRADESYDINLLQQEEIYREQRKAMVNLVVNYYQSLMRAFKGEPTNPMKYPLIARWVELLTRNKNGNE